MHTILVVEDEEDIADLVAFNLRRNEFQVELAHDGIQGLAKAKEVKPDLIVLDVMMPGLDGFRVFKELRKDKSTRTIPVIMLTARGQTEDRIQGLELGAEDYMTKPFSPKELVLRIRNLLKRSTRKISGNELVCGPFRFVKNALQFFLDDQQVDLTSTEFKLLLYLCERQNASQDRHTLLMDVMGYSSEVHSRTLDTHMKRLRKKLGVHADIVETVRGVGYQVKLLS
ncbi:MAG TPA: DNA-binding response regulator [Verrucomicrobiales bacterium]|jgi:two-component system phosphate regulon response regulator PhoB|nr:DNA-binding response regulator [Verrucomicrobiales bacterium]HCL97515.1 DNA-binding response regulator [Verrucomicrobiales bacterium]